jgi:asparagine synthase (glutamine-hydrolysing)
MCGICGKVNFDREEPVDGAMVLRMMDTIRHRGPDGSGQHTLGPVGLGHLRLSIIDLSTGDQPIYNEDGSVCVVYNGEIYNFLELRADLERRGHRFRTKTDTEVIVHAYEEWGESAVTRFRGMFAFALWDASRELLLLARDRVGIKPLYYVNTGRSLLFASEIKALLADPCVPRQINPRAIDRFLTDLFVPGSETMFEGIHKLDPGHTLTVRDGRAVTREYWDLNFEETRSKLSFSEAVEELQALLGQTVKDHMISDVPVGVFLSGGLDSTGVLGYAIEQTGKPIRTFTIGFEGAGFVDERPFARRAAQRYGTEHLETTLTAEDFVACLSTYVWHMEEPVCEPPAIALYWLSKLARNANVKVLLSGEGGDEAFGGYKTYTNVLLVEAIKRATGPAKSLISVAFQALAGAGWTSATYYRSLIDQPLWQYYHGRTSTPPNALDGLKSRMYRSELQGSLSDSTSKNVVGRRFGRMEGRGALDHMLYVDTKSWLPDRLLVKADKMTMAASIELRVPLLDHQVLEFAASLPADFKVRNSATKRLLRAALQDRVPPEIVNRKKAGFPVPYEMWLNTQLKDFVADTLTSKSTALTSYFDRKELGRFVESSQGGRRHYKELFSLVVLELWLQRFQDAPIADVA